MDELRQIRSMSNLYASMGWKGTTHNLFWEHVPQSVRSTKDTISLTSASNKTSQDLYSTKGTVQNWVELTNLLESRYALAYVYWALGSLPI